MPFERTESILGSSPTLYRNRYEDQFHNVYNSEATASVNTLYRGHGWNTTAGWPVVKKTNEYWAGSWYAPDKTISYDFSNPDGQKSSGTQSAWSLSTGAGAVEAMDRYGWDVFNRVFDRAKELATSRLASEVGNGKVNLLQAYAEREQVANLVISTARRIAQSITSLRRGNFAAASHALFGSTTKSSRHLRDRVDRVAGGIPEQWLALQYGWKPLLSDVYGSCEELARTITGRNCPAYQAQGTGAEKEQKEFLHVSASGLPDWIWYFDFEARSRVRVEYEVLSEGASFLSRTGITNPALLAWELLPYSFVVDWFYPVGTFLQNCDFASGLGFRQGYYSTKVTGKFGVRAVNLSKPPPGVGSTGQHWTGGYGGCTLTGKFEAFKRDPIFSWPAVSPPRLKDPFSPTHVANALSLLATAVSGGRKVR
jgi:hypothetical protein